ncbi:MAG: hypothetical protein II706_01650 [Bacteroidaceae bacterium]|nr:hypothetical protein [Bacteroidaceae bacterium]
MMKILTRGTHLFIERRRLSRCIINSLLMVMLMVVFVLRLLLWPLRQLNKGLAMSGRWMFSHLD